MQDVYLLLGSNLGDREKIILEAAKRIGKGIGEIVEQSAMYQTASWGKTSEPDYINQVLHIRTAQSARGILQDVLDIEKAMGRVRHEKWGSRIIDIDILFYGNEVVNEPDLVIPHPHLHERAFVLIPLSEIAAPFVHPVLGKTVEELKEHLTDTLLVKRL